MQECQTTSERFISKTCDLEMAYWLIDPQSGEIGYFTDLEGEHKAFLFWSDKLIAESVLQQHFPTFKLAEISLFELLIESCCATPEVIHVGLDWTPDVTGHCFDGSYLKQCYQDKMPNEMLTRFNAYQSEQLSQGIRECLVNNEIWVLYDPTGGFVAGEFVNREWSALLLCFSNQAKAIDFRDRSYPDFEIQSIGLFHFLCDGSPYNMYGLFWGINWGKIAGITIDSGWLKSYFRAIMLPDHLQEFEAFAREEAEHKQQVQQQFIDEILVNEQVWGLFDKQLGFACNQSPMNHQLICLFWSSKEQAELEQQSNHQNYQCLAISLFDFLYTDMTMIESTSLGCRVGLNLSSEQWCLEVSPFALQNSIESQMPPAMHDAYMKKMNEEKSQ